MNGIKKLKIVLNFLLKGGKKNMELMDVTLRESVYYGSGIDYDEGLDYLKRIKCFINPSDVQYIEICYINNNSHGHLNYDSDYIKSAHEICKGSFKIVGMMHPDKADISKWDSKTICLFSMVRIVCGDEIPDIVKEFIDYFHKLNVKVSINISFAMSRTLERNEYLCKKAVLFGADYVYFADSSGSSFSNDICSLCEILLNNKKNNKTGFHLHDHLGLSFSNAIEVYKNGIDITDVSITGAGRGGGNLKTEFIIPFLSMSKNGNIEREVYHKLLNYIDYFNALVKRDGNIYKQLFLDTLSGIYRLGLKQQETLETNAGGDGHKYIDYVFDAVAKK